MTRTSKRIATFAIAVAFAIAFVVLVGWIFNIPQFRDLNSGRSMQTNTSIASLCASIALFIFFYGHFKENVRKYILQVLGLVVVSIGITSLSRFILGWGTGLSDIVNQYVEPTYTEAVPERVSMNSAVGLVLLGIAIILIPYRKRLTVWISQSLSIAVGLVALASFLLFLFSPPSAQSMQNIKMATHTAVVLFLLSFGILACYPKNGLMGLLTGSEFGSIFARRLTLLTILLPAFISWAVYFLLQKNWLYPLPGISLLAFDAFVVTLLMTVCLTVLVWKNAMTIREMEVKETTARLKALEVEEKLQESVDQLTVALEAAQMGTWLWNLKSQTITWNFEQEILFGYELGAPLDTFEKFKEIIHPDDVQTFLRDLEKSILNRQVFDRIFRIVGPDQTIKWVLSRGKCYYDKNGEPLKMMGVITDVTLLKASEIRLKEALQARDEFLSIASHELKTPLTSLKIQNQVVKRAIEKNDSNAYSRETIDRLVCQTDRQVSRLTRLVDDMLDIARIRSGKMTIVPEEIDLCELVRELVERMRPQFLLSLSEMPKIDLCEGARGYWDKVRIEQVVTNLLTNAIRYGRGNPIEIRVEAREKGVRLSVKDFGIGIAADNHAKIFDRFERAASASAIGGLGLGLFITKQIVRSHGGKIWVESELGKGSTFYVDLPYRLARKVLRKEAYA